MLLPRGRGDSNCKRGNKKNNKGELVGKLKKIADVPKMLLLPLVSQNASKSNYIAFRS